MKTLIRPVLIALALCIAPCTSLFAAESPVLRVVVVHSDNVEAYVKELARGQEILKKMQSAATIRVFRARFAGPNAGAVVVAVEYPNIASLASDDAKIAASTEYRDWIKGLDKFRKIESDSLYEELKP
jgi:hypothetical protein